MKRFAFAIALILPSIAHAGDVTVVGAEASRQGNGSYRFSVTLKHADSGWDHFADRWQVLSPDGTVLATRVLAHPHEHEQPFTRSLSGVDLPTDLSSVRIRAHDSVHGDTKALFTLKVPR